MACAVQDHGRRTVRPALLRHLRYGLRIATVQRLGAAARMCLDKSLQGLSITGRHRDQRALRMQRRSRGMAYATAGP